MHPLPTAASVTGSEAHSIVPAATGKVSLVAKGHIDLTDWAVDLDVGRLGMKGDARTLKKYRITGPASHIKVEARK